MDKILAILFFLCIISCEVNAQILPKEGGKLNYRIIGFKFPAKDNGSKYKIEIAQDTYDDEHAFNKNIIKSFSSDTNRIIGEVPSFGTKYTWRTIFTDKNGTKTKSELHHFSTMIIPSVDTNVTRLRIIKGAKKYKDAYVFLDELKTLYDMTGHPVWYLPDNKGFEKKNYNAEDIKLTPQKTITFMLSRRDASICEINYNGDILWKGPNNGKVSGDSEEHYNHEFTRLKNGHYMVLGKETVLWELPSFDSNIKTEDWVGLKRIGHKFYQSLLFGTIIEYNENGDVVWAWRSSDYFKTSDVYFKRDTNGIFQIGFNENSFYFDEESNTIFLNCSDKMGRVLKIKYPEGNVLNDYGEKYKICVAEVNNELFCGQHSLRYSQRGYLYLYNNNACYTGKMPTVERLEETVNDKYKYGLKKIWEYVCTIDKVNDNKTNVNTEWAKEYFFKKGGNVLELPDLSMFVSMCGSYL